MHIRVMSKARTRGGVTTEAMFSEYAVVITDDQKKITIYRDTGPATIEQGTTFGIGDQAEYDSYNLSYVGVIEKITPKTVTITKSLGGNTKRHRLNMYEFCWRNHKFDAAEIRARNAIESMNF
jgi:hypothetical protein